MCTKLNRKSKDISLVKMTEKIRQMHPASAVLSALLIKTGTFASNVDQDAMAHNEPSHLDLHRLPLFLSTDTLFGIMGIPKFKVGKVPFRNSGVKWLN